MTPVKAPPRQRWHRRARHALGHSLRVRLLAMFLLLALGMSATFLFGMQYALGIGWRDAARPLVVDYVDKLAAEIGSPPSTESALAITRRLPLSVSISGPVVNWHSSTADAEADANHRRWGGDAPRFFERTTADGHRIRFGISVQAWEARPRAIGWFTLFTLLVLVALAYARVRYLLRPLDDIRAGAQRFGAGDFAQPIAVRHPRKPDELGDLAATINTMGSDIDRMLEAKRALLLAISHELRSPLTRARLNTELLPENPDVQPSRDALLRDLALMRDLVTDLLESERLSGTHGSAPHAALHRETVDLAALVADVVTALPGAPQVSVQIDAPLPPLALDPVRIRLLLRNLLDNALRHSAEAAQPPLLVVQADGQGGLALSVRDYGTGVPEDQLPHLGQPFFRPDAARTREEGGVGLGLYLCKLVAQAHGGTFTVRNANPGLHIGVQLPAQ